jgi:hypothetical protein
MQGIPNSSRVAAWGNSCRRVFRGPGPLVNHDRKVRASDSTRRPFGRRVVACLSAAAAWRLRLAVGVEAPCRVTLVG